MKYIKRWSLMRSSREENVMEHSYEVTMIAHALALINNKIFNGTADPFKTAMIAQYHETGEVLTGDLPTPIKYFNPEIRDAYKDIEHVSCEKILKMLPEELYESYREVILPDKESEEAKLAKYADKISAFLKCVDELKAGNTEFKKAKCTIEKELKSYKSKEVDYFLKEFAPAFSLVLDEIG